MLKHLTFVKNLKYDNSECIRKIPYEGVSWFAIYNKDVEAYKNHYDYYAKRFDITDLSDFIFVKGTEMKIKSIKALDFDEVNDYVLGNSDVTPKLLDFIPKIHTIQMKNNLLLSQGFGRQTLKNLGIPLRIPSTNFQVLIK